MNVLRAFWMDQQRRHTLAWVLGVVGALILLAGGYTLLEAHSKYTELSAVIDRLGPPEDPNDASNAAFALMLRDRDKAGVRRGQGVMWIGIGVIGLGLAYVAKPEDAAGPAAVDAPADVDRPPDPAP